MAAPNITQDFITRLKDNGAAAEAMAVHWYDFLGGPGNAAAKEGVRWGWFYQKVRAGGPWDFKSNVYKSHKDTGVEVCGNVYRFDMPGNFHYGFVGAAAGFSAWTLHRAAGWAQERAGTSKPEYHCTHGDDPEDYEFIRLGIQLYDDVGLDVTTTNLSRVLSFFRTLVCEAEE